MGLTNFIYWDRRVIPMNKFFNPDPLEFKKLEKERVINKLEKP